MAMQFGSGEATDMAQHGGRARIPFRAVNRRSMPDHDPGLQRHHLLPRQLLSKTCFARMFDVLDIRSSRFEDFRRNGVLLPCREASAFRMGLPLHRGPHRCYNELVITRVGQIEAGWSRAQSRNATLAGHEALMRLALLQRGLRRFLMNGRRRRIKLNRFDPGDGGRFNDIDAMVDAMWGATEPQLSASPFEPQPRGGLWGDDSDFGRAMARLNAAYATESEAEFGRDVQSPRREISSVRAA